MKRITLTDQIKTIVDAKSWVLPDEQKANKGYTNLGEVSDYVKGVYTLLANKIALIAEKKQKLNEINSLQVEELPFASLMFSLMPMHGMRTSAEMVSGNPRDVLTEDPKTLAALRTEIAILICERDTVEQMLRLELYDIISSTFPGTKKYREMLTTDFCLHAQIDSNDDKLESIKSMIVEKVLEDTTNVLHCIVMPHDHELTSQFAELIQMLKENEVAIFGGFIPRLATETTKVLFFPVDVDEKALYHEHRDEDDSEEATNRREKARSLFSTIVNTGTKYVPVAEKEEAMAQ